MFPDGSEGVVIRSKARDYTVQGWEKVTEANGPFEDIIFNNYIFVKNNGSLEERNK